MLQRKKQRKKQTATTIAYEDDIQPQTLRKTEEVVGINMSRTLNKEPVKQASVAEISLVRLHRLESFGIYCCGGKLLTEECKGQTPGLR